MFSMKKLATLGAEFIGTAVLTMAIISVKASGIGYSFFVALGAGVALAVLVFLLNANTTAQFNPALTVGLWTARKVSTLRAVAFIVVQLLAGWAAYGIYTYLANPHLPAASQHYVARMMIAEAIGAFVFAFGWAVAAARRYEGITLAATIGGAFAVGIMLASLASLGLVNPAIALGVRSWNIWGSAGWGVYVLGPVIGGIVGVNAYNLIFSGNYDIVQKARVTSKKK